MKNIAILLATILIPLSSQALFEVRAGYGMVTLDEDQYAGAVNVDDLKGFNLDVLIEPPLITDMGFGLRYEKMSADISGTGVDGKVDFDRVSALVNYRFIDMFAYFGVIGSLGISNKVEVTNNGATDTDWSEKLNYSIGLEGGVSLGLFQVGAEVGKLFAKAEQSGSSDLDLSGIYAKALVGFGF